MTNEKATTLPELTPRWGSGNRSSRVMPITPHDLPKGLNVPEEVIETFNEKIAESWNGLESVVLLEDVVKKVCALMNITREKAFEKRLFDVEYIYQNAGWEVEFSKPGYNENPFKSFFRFRKQ